MLYLTRKVGETVIINNNIEVTVIEVKGKTVKIGFTFPHTATVLRKETHDKIMQENMAAASQGLHDGHSQDEELLDTNFSASTPS